MTGEVWVSAALMRARTRVELSSEGYVSETCRESGTGWDHYFHGKTIPVECFPTMLFVYPNYGPLKSLPDFFRANGYWCVSEKAASVLSKHDLGGAAFIKINATQEDKRTELPGNYFFINFGRKKSVFVPEQTVGAKKPNLPRIDWGLSLSLEDELVAVNKDALVGQDMWFDAHVNMAIFFSNKLYDAMKTAGVHEAFKLVRCKVVGG